MTTVNQNTVGVIASMALFTSAAELDVYVVLRMFRFFCLPDVDCAYRSNQPYVVYYAGDRHTQNLIKFLKLVDPMVIIHNYDKCPKISTYTMNELDIGKDGCRCQNMNMVIGNCVEFTQNFWS